MRNTKVLTVLSALLLALLCLSCNKNAHEAASTLKIGSQDESRVEVTLPRKSKRDIILSGGSGKFRVSVADSRVATATVSQDTLTIKGLREGETYATIRSMDLVAKLQIYIKPNELHFTQSSITLRPKELNSSVAFGGGTIVKLTVDDPDHVVDVKWRQSGILDIYGLAEG